MMGKWGIYLRFFRESVTMAFQSMVNDKLRTALSLLGVTIGIFSIISVFTLIDTFEEGLKDSLAVINDKVMFIQRMPMGPEEGETEYEIWKYLQRRQPSLGDLYDLQDRKVDGIQSAAFSSGTSKTVQYRNSSQQRVGVAAVSQDYREAVALTIGEGRYFTPMEFAGGQNGALIGSDWRYGKGRG